MQKVNENNKYHSQILSKLSHLPRLDIEQGFFSKIRLNSTSRKQGGNVMIYNKNTFEKSHHKEGINKRMSSNQKQQLNKKSNKVGVGVGKIKQKSNSKKSSKQKTTNDKDNNNKLPSSTTTTNQFIQQQLQTTSINLLKNYNNDNNKDEQRNFLNNFQQKQQNDKKQLRLIQSPQRKSYEITQFYPVKQQENESQSIQQNIEVDVDNKQQNEQNDNALTTTMMMKKTIKMNNNQNNQTITSINKPLKDRIKQRISQQKNCRKKQSQQTSSSLKSTQQLLTTKTKTKIKDNHYHNTVLYNTSNFIISSQTQQTQQQYQNNNIKNIKASNDNQYDQHDQHDKNDSKKQFSKQTKQTKQLNSYKTIQNLMKNKHNKSNNENNNKYYYIQQTKRKSSSSLIKQTNNNNLYSFAADPFPTKIISKVNEVNNNNQVDKENNENEQNLTRTNIKTNIKYSYNSQVPSFSTISRSATETRFKSISVFDHLYNNSIRYDSKKKIYKAIDDAYKRNTILTFQPELSRKSHQLAESRILQNKSKSLNKKQLNNNNNSLDEVNKYHQQQQQHQHQRQYSSSIILENCQKRNCYQSSSTTLPSPLQLLNKKTKYKNNFQTIQEKLLRQQKQNKNIMETKHNNQKQKQNKEILIMIQTFVFLSEKTKQTAAKLQRQINTRECLSIMNITIDSMQKQIQKMPLSLIQALDPLIKEIYQNHNRSVRLQDFIGMFEQIIQIKAKKTHVINCLEKFFKHLRLKNNDL